MTFTFTIRISLCFSSAREFQMGNFQKYWSQNVGQDFIILYFFSRAEDFESWWGGQKEPSKSGEKCSRRKVHIYVWMKNIQSLETKKGRIYLKEQKIKQLSLKDVKTNIISFCISICCSITISFCIVTVFIILYIVR